MAIGVGATNCGFPVQFTASAQVAGGAAMARTQSPGPNNSPQVAETTALAGTILGFIVNTTTAGIIQFYGGTSASGTALGGPLTPTVGVFYPWAGSHPAGIFCNLNSGSINCTFFVVE